jgi:hypothetical protein
MDILDQNYFELRNFIGAFEWCTWKDNSLSKGVRQGDSLSPLFFVLAADLLQSLVNEAF